MNYSSFFPLIWKDLVVFFRDFFSKFLDALIIFFTIWIIYRVFMPEFGLANSYTPFIIFGAIASFGFFETIGNISSFIGDLTGDKTVSYRLMLPLSSFYSLSTIALSWAISSLVLTVLLVPVAKIVLWDQWLLSQCSFGKFIIIFPTIQLFFGFFSFWVASFVKQLVSTGWIWVRVVTPLYMFGCYFYPWELLHKSYPVIAYIHFLNPLTFVMEGMRAAALGQEGYLNFWFCFIALWSFTVFFSWDSYRRLKKRLDCI
jgi:ABC-2 type transport system permease protein